MPNLEFERASADATSPAHCPPTLATTLNSEPLAAALLRKQRACSCITRLRPCPRWANPPADNKPPPAHGLTEMPTERWLQGWIKNNVNYDAKRRTHAYTRTRTTLTHVPKNRILQSPEESITNGFHEMSCPGALAPHSFLNSAAI